MELRCPNKFHGVVRNGRLEVMCRSAFCGKRVGVVVMHYFDLQTGKMTTHRFKDPGVTNHEERKEDQDALGYRTAVRHS